MPAEAAKEWPSRDDGCQPFKYFRCLTSTPKIIRWAVIMSVRFQLSPRVMIETPSSPDRIFGAADLHLA